MQGINDVTGEKSYIMDPQELQVLRFQIKTFEKEFKEITFFKIYLEKKINTFPKVEKVIQNFLIKKIQ